MESANAHILEMDLNGEVDGRALANNRQKPFSPHLVWDI